MYLPTLKENKQSRLMTSEFGGYDRRLRIGDGQWREMQNMTGDCYPMLASRTPRGIGEEIASPAGLTAKDALIWVSGSKIVIGGKAVELGLSEGVKQLVSMGAYLVIWPDKKSEVHQHGGHDGLREHRRGVRGRGERAGAACNVRRGGRAL